MIASHPNEGDINVDDEREGGINIDDEYEESQPEGAGAGAGSALKVGHIQIIDLSSDTASQILKSDISAEEFSDIAAATEIKSIVLSDYATELSNALEEKRFDPIVHSDAAFIEVTARQFLDLMSSPRNPLNQRVLERTAATYFIIFIVNQLFISNNDVIELDWLEREFFATDRTKWDGVLIKADNRSCSAGARCSIVFSYITNVLYALLCDYNNNHNVNSNATFTLTEEQKEALYQRFAQRYYGIYTCNKFHTYGIKTQPLATKCSQDISLLVNPDCKYHVHHFESNDTHLSQYKLSFAESGTEVALRQTANLASDEVGRLQIIDLPSTTALDILRLGITIDQFNAIIEAANMDPVPMFVYASELSNALDKAPLSTCVLRETLYDVGYRKDFDLVAHDDAHFMEITISLDLMSSPNSPLNKIMLGRTAASYLIIYLVNQLFIANNDVIELGWLEREFYSTDRSKFDGVLFKVGKVF
ncbi:hypothetical protein G6F64_000369 [Rhizopus arrhizus]|uniref:Uncharacterized protein n=1 Tax=Rhizopus oryzae TaxID=64495 RepID=A0A9P6XKA4_RHIOR|nr:hypothetical protein G6F64_000369 [Rhizopus arrhizus]